MSIGAAPKLSYCSANRSSTWRLRKIPSVLSKDPLLRPHYRLPSGLIRPRQRRCYLRIRSRFGCGKVGGCTSRPLFHSLLELIFHFVCLKPLTHSVSLPGSIHWD